MFHSRPSGRRLAATSLLIGMTATAVLVGCQRLGPSIADASSPADLESITSTTTAYSNASVLAAEPSSVLPFERLDAPTATIQPDMIWTAPPISSYAFESIDPASLAPATAESSAVIESETPAASEAAEPEQTAAGVEAAAPRPDTGTLFESGIASTYGESDGFQGNRTACGQRFDTNVPQVAHKSLPCGTMVRVEDASSGRSVVVEVTDRGPYVKGRVVDLSWAAFSQLHPKGPDLLSVNVYVLGK
jgi:rare lipoprotein A (peptidoglycan hydrolase)